MAKYQKYAEYKDTGIKLLGEVPKHWQVASVRRYLLDHRQGYYTTESYVDDGLKLLRITDLRDLGEIDILNCPMVKQNESTDLFKLKKGDVVFARTGGAGSFGVITKNYENLIYASYLIRFRFMDVKFESNYLRYLCLSDSFQLSVKQNIHGGVNQNIHAEDIKDTVICTPPLLEQNQITKFLDQETAKINLLIAKQEKLIELLKEKRQAVISHAVTKGLNPNVPMKDSGVEWLGEVPEHWSVIAISKLTQKITNGYVGPTRDILVEDGIPYVQATHIKKGKVNFDNAYFVREKWSNDHAKSILKKDDVLIVQTGAGTGDVGLVSEAEEGFNCHALIILQPKKKQLSGSYLAYCLQSDYGYATLYSIRTGGMHPHLNCGEVQFVKIPVPPLNEQITISDFIEKNIRDFDSLVEKAKSAIQLMQERRTALISAAVTGKIDVRNWQHPNQHNNNNTELSA